MAEKTIDKFIVPSTKRRTYKIDTSNVKDEDILIINLKQRSNKKFKRHKRILGNLVSDKKEISFSVFEDGKGINIVWDYERPNTSGEYFSYVADELFFQIHRFLNLKVFTDNPILIGAYCESIVRNWLRNNFFNESILTGAIISPDIAIQKTKLKQLDTIIYSPSPLPAIFRVDDFGLVPANSAFGIIEIKSTDYSNAVKDIISTLKYINDKIKKRDISITITDQDPNIKPINITLKVPESFGIVCFKEKKNIALVNYANEEKILFILNYNSKGKVVVNRKNVLLFVNKVLKIKHAMTKSIGLLSKKEIDSVK